MDKWEYKSIKVETSGLFGGKLDLGSFNMQLDSLGADGWELVSCFDTSQSYGASKEVIAVFKRRVGQ